MKNFKRYFFYILYCFLFIWIYLNFSTISIIAAEKTADRITKSNHPVENRTPPDPGFHTDLSGSGTGNSKVRIGKNSTGVRLSWQPVTADISGQAEDLAGYEILRANAAYFSPGYDFLLATTSQAQFVDETAAPGASDILSLFYLVRARDWWGNISLPSNRVGVAALALEPGWNLIALPVELNDLSLAAATGNRISSANSPEQSALICSFDPARQQFSVSWLHAAQSKWHGEVQRLERGQGYFIKLPQNDPVALDLIGYVPEVPISVKIRPGWNLIGNPLPTSVPLRQSGLIQSGFGGAPNRTNSDQIFQLQDTGYRQAWFNSAAQSWEGDFDQLEIGTGYWIYRHENRGDFDWICPIPEAK